ncbi:MAG: transporter [Clostridiales bacterium]|nr:transporter [Clostridiales bacterium]
MNSFIICWNVIKRLLQQKLSFGFLVIFPVLAGLFVVLMMGKAGGTKQILAVSNLDKGAIGGELIQFLDNSNMFKIINIDDNSIEKKVESNEYPCGIILPENFTASIAVKEDTLVRIVEYSPSAAGQQAKEMINMYLDGVYSGESVKMDISSVEDKMSPISDQTRSYLGFLLIMVMMFMGTGIGMILEDKKEKTFMRIFAAPVREYEMILGNVLASFILGLLQVTLYITVTTLLFKVDWGTSLINVIIISLVYLISAVGISIGMAGFITDNQKYSIINLISIVPVSILGGCFFSAKWFPDSIQKVANFIPQMWAMDAFEKLASGNEFSSIWMNLMVLVLFGIVFFTFGVKTLRVGNEDL